MNHIRSIKSFSRGLAVASSLVQNQTPEVAKGSVVLASKWKPSKGNSFKTFAEYRLKAVNQSPLHVRARSKKHEVNI